MQQRLIVLRETGAKGKLYAVQVPSSTGKLVPIVEKMDAKSEAGNRPPSRMTVPVVGG